MINKQNDDILRPKFGRNLVIAFVLGTAIFALVFLLGYTISSNKLQEVYSAQEQMRYDILSFQVQQELADKDCTMFNPESFSSEMRRVGNLLDILEKRLGKNDQSVIDQKKTYTLLEIRHYLYLKQHNDVCKNNTFPTVLFFYSNKPEYSDDAKNLGYMLTYLWEKNSNITVYSFDYEISSDILDMVKEKYRVTQPNTLVINEKASINHFDNADQIARLL